MSENLSWNFDVKSNISNEKITVEFDGIEQLPEGKGFALIDRDTGKILQLNRNAFSFVSGKDFTERHFTLKFDTNEKLEKDYYASKPEQYLVARFYPNPFNPSTTIQYELGQSGDVTISIYNTLGQMVRRYDIGHKEPGIHDIVFDAAGLTSGVYIFHVKTGYASVTDKMLFVK
jgi:hypothetical protein